MDTPSLTDLNGQWAYHTLPPNIRFGTGCYFEARKTFTRFRSTMPLGLEIGNNVRIHLWTEFNVEPAGTMRVGDDSVLAGAVFMCALRIEVGKSVIISHRVTIADADFHPVSPELRRLDAIALAPGNKGNGRQPYIAEPVTISDHVMIGMGAIILKGVTIGRGARIGAGAVVTNDVPAGAYVAGNPARVETTS